ESSFDFPAAPSRFFRSSSNSSQGRSSSQGRGVRRRPSRKYPPNRITNPLTPTPAPSDTQISQLKSQEPAMQTLFRKSLGHEQVFGQNANRSNRSGKRQMEPGGR